MKLVKILGMAIFMIMPQVLLANYSIAKRIQIIERKLDSRQELDLYAQIDRGNEEISELRGKIEELEQNLSQLKEQQKLMFLDLDNRLRSYSKQDINLSSQSEDISFLVNSKQLYEESYSYLSEKNYIKAKEGFTKFITDNPSSEYIANAYYWLGELYLLEHDYDKAEISFNFVVTNYADHHKAADSLFKLGVINQNKGELAKAKSIFEDIKLKYPNSALERLAIVQLAQIHNTGN